MGFGSVNVFERGQVWMVAEPEDVTQAKINAGDRTICYTRPCVVLTPANQIGGPLITVVPITSKLGVVKEHDIVFRNHDLEQNKIMVNQLSTKDSDMFIRYMFTMPEDIMRAIEEQVVLITGLSLSTSESSENLTQKIGELEKELAKAKECIKLLHKELDKNAAADSAVSIETTTKKSSRTPKKKWSEEQAIAFIKDGGHMTTEELMKKYGLATKGSVHSTRYLLKKKYGECTSC